jgi:hypothetical protein
MFTAPLHSNNRGTDHTENTSLLLFRAFISAGTSLPGRSLALNLCSDSVILAVGRHVTLLLLLLLLLLATLLPVEFSVHKNIQ